MGFMVFKFCAELVLTQLDREGLFGCFAVRYLRVVHVPARLVF